MTLILLVLHQIDAAYWKEWNMFYLPGGVQGFLLFNLIAFPIVIIGYKKLLLQSEGYLSYSYLCGGLGLITFIIHLGFAIFGLNEFNLPFSIVIIVMCGVFGLLQLILTRRTAAKSINIKSA